jgi:hypothetical protein
MSTDLYRVRVLSVDANLLTCDVTAIYPDAPLVPSPSFAAQILWDVWQLLAIGLLEEEEDNRFFGLKTSITVEEAKNLASHAAIGQIGDTDKWCDEKWVLEKTTSIVDAVVVTEKTLRAASELGYSTDEVFTSAKFRIELSNPEWCSHVFKDMEWCTTSYPMEGDA